MAQTRKCRSRPFAWSERSVAKSPFHTMKNARLAERKFRQGKSIGFTARSSLKSMGRISRSSGCYELGSKYAS
jgi:hypothetical protein